MNDSRSHLDRALDLFGRQFLKHSASVGAIRMVGLVCIFAMQVLLARLMVDTDEYGKYAWGQSLLFMMGGIAGLGIPAITGRFVAALRAQGLERNIPAIIQRGQQVLLCSTAVLFLVGLTLHFLAGDSNGEGYYSSIAALSAFMAPVVSFGLLYQYLSQGRQWMVTAFIPMYVARPILTAALAGALWFCSGSPLTGLEVLALVGLSMVLAHGVQAVLFHRWQQPILRDPNAMAGDSEYSPQRLVHNALPLFITRLANLFIEYSNVLLVGYLAGPAAAGAYFAAERLAILASMPWKVFSPVAQPEYAAAHARGEEQKLRRLVRRTAHAVFWPTAAIAAVLMAMAQPLLSIFGEDFEQGSTVLVLLVLAPVVRTALGPVADLLLMTGQQKLMPPVFWSTAILHATCLLLLVPQYGPVGAAFTTVLGILFSHSILALLTWRKLHMNPTVFAWGRE